MNGYPRFGWVDIIRFQHTNSRLYVSRMELCCRLLELASDNDGIEGIYVNIHNASRYIGRIFSQYDFDKIGKDKDDNLKVLRLSVLRRAKAC